MALNRVPLAGLLLAVAGCMHVVSVKPAEYIPLHNPAVVWVTYIDDSYVPVAQPKIVGDSLKGTWSGLGEPIAISLNEIQTVQAKIPSPKRTIILFTTLGLASTAVIYTLLTAGTGGKQNTCLDRNQQALQYCE
jgi:hypothetical protein